MERKFRDRLFEWTLVKKHSVWTAPNQGANTADTTSRCDSAAWTARCLTFWTRLSFVSLCDYKIVIDIHWYLLMIHVLKQLLCAKLHRVASFARNQTCFENKILPTPKERERRMLRRRTRGEPRKLEIHKNLRQPHSKWDMYARLEMFQLDSKNEWKWILFLFQSEEKRPNCHTCRDYGQ